MSKNALQEAEKAVSKLKKAVYWKPGKDIQHLKKRKALGHLPQDCQIKNYNKLFGELVQGLENEVYLYEFGSQRYYMIKRKNQGEGVDRYFLYRRNNRDSLSSTRH